MLKASWKINQNKDYLNIKGEKQEHPFILGMIILSNCVPKTVLSRSCVAAHLLTRQS